MPLRDWIPTTRLGRVSALAALVLLLLIVAGWALAAVFILASVPAAWAGPLTG